MPSTRRPFWEAKLSGNAARDQRNGEALRSLGWKVMTVWECELADEECVVRSMGAALKDRHG